MNSLWILGGNLVWAFMAMTPIHKPHFAYKMEKRNWGLYRNLCFKLETGCTENRWRGVLLTGSRPPTHNSPYLLLKWESPDACGFFMLYYLSVFLSHSLSPTPPPRSPPPPVSAHLRIIWLFISLLLIYLYHLDLTANIHYYPYNILENIFITVPFCVFIHTYKHNLIHNINFWKIFAPYILSVSVTVNRNLGAVWTFKTVFASILFLIANIQN